MKKIKCKFPTWCERVLEIMRRDTLSSFVGTFSVLWVIISSGGVFLNSKAIVNFTLLFSVALFVVQIVLLRKLLFKRFSAPVMYWLLICVCVLLSVLVNWDLDSFLTYARLILILSLALGTSLLVSNDRIAELFVRIVFVLALVSIVLFYSDLVGRNSGFFPVIEFNGNKYVNGFFYLHFNSVENRNFSIFIEPGLYQVYLNVALFAVLYGNVVIRRKYLIALVLLIAIYSTKSTTGYILGVVIVFGLVFYKVGGRHGFLLSVFKVVVLLLGIGVVVASEYFVGNLSEKFSGSNQLSYNTRQNSTLIDLQLIARDPLTGGGVGNYQNSLDEYSARGFSIDSATNTFTQLGAILGLPFIFLVIWRGVLYVMRVGVNFVAKFIFLILYLVLFATEPFVLYPLFYLPVFMSFRLSSFGGGLR